MVTAMRRIVLALAVASSLAACTHHHGAPVARAQLPPPPEPMQRHTGRLFVELGEHTDKRQCVAGPARPLCFLEVREAVGEAIVAGLWPSFPEVRVKQKGDDLLPGDYLLLLSVDLGALPPDEAGPGWSATATASWQLVRDGIPLAGESLASRSRSSFAFGAELGVGAGEVVDAVVTHVATTVGSLPELRPLVGAPLPPVHVTRRHGPLFVAEPADDSVAKAERR